MVWRGRPTWETDFFRGGWGVLTSDDVRFFWLFTMGVQPCPTSTTRQPTAPPRPHARLPIATPSLPPRSPPSRKAHHLATNKTQGHPRLTPSVTHAHTQKRTSRQKGIIP